MPLPDTFAELAIAGYQHTGAGRCRACGARLEWFRTKKNRPLPFSMKQEVRVSEDAIYSVPSITRLEPHFASCPKAEQFRKKRKAS